MEKQREAYRRKGSYGANNWRKAYGNEIDILAVQSAVAAYRFPRESLFYLDLNIWTSVAGKTRLNKRWEKFAHKCVEWTKDLAAVAQLFL
jgi:hypothetical protein